MKKITELRQAIKNGYNLYFNGHIIENINFDSLQLSGMVRVKFADSDELIWVDINEIKVSSLTELENVAESKNFDLFENLAAATKPDKK